jgi:hypothetical protein
MLEVEFVGQIDNVHAEIGCGVASTMMLLKYHCDSEIIPSYQNLCNELKANDPPDMKGYPSTKGMLLGAYAEDIMAYFARAGLRYRAWFDYPTLQERIKHGPIMAEFGINSRLGSEEGHWVVLIEVTEDKVIYLDPAHKTRASKKHYQVEVSSNEFMDNWSGNAIQLIGFNKLRPPRGQWTGQVTEPNIGKYTIIMTLANCVAGAECGNVEYEGNDCHSTLIYLTTLEENKYHFREKFIPDNDDYQSDGVIILQPKDDKVWSWRWVYGDRTAYGSLTKIK